MDQKVNIWKRSINAPKSTSYESPLNLKPKYDKYKDKSTIKSS